MTAASACGYCEPMRQTTGFARLPDGKRVAFAVAGSGPAVVLPAWWVSNLSAPRISVGLTIANPQAWRRPVR
jgi:hypothetical protein